jgi:hypothetical protein
LDYSGGYNKQPLPMQQVLIGPLQYLQAEQVAVCCDATLGYFGCPLDSACIVHYHHNETTCCHEDIQLLFENDDIHHHHHHLEEQQELVPDDGEFEGLIDVSVDVMNSNVVLGQVDQDSLEEFERKFGEGEAHQYVMKRISKKHAHIMRKLFSKFRFHALPFESFLLKTHSRVLDDDDDDDDVGVEEDEKNDDNVVYCSDYVGELGLRIEYEPVMWRNALSPFVLLKVPIDLSSSSSSSSSSQSQQNKLKNIQASILSPLKEQFVEICQHQKDYFHRGWNEALCVTDLLWQVHQVLAVKCRPSRNSPKSFIRMDEHELMALRH